MISSEAKLRASKKYYDTHKEDCIERVIKWQKENKEKQYEYTKKYYNSEKGKLKKAEQNRRYYEKIKAKKSTNENVML